MITDSHHSPKAAVKDQILVVGGYGSVGRTICETLGNRFPGKVIAAGRNYTKAEQLSVQTEQKVLPMVLDVSTAHKSDELLHQVVLVIMCLDQNDTRFVEKCILQGVHYIDISAKYDLLSRIELLHTQAQEHGTTVVLSVGLAPGLTNLLASYCKTVLNEVAHVDIFILLGLGEAHGEAAICWTLENVNTAFLRQNGTRLQAIKGFGQGKAVVFPEPYRKRMAYCFNFADQHVIGKTLGIGSAATWLCFDSAFLTQAIASMRKTGLSNVLRMRFVEDIFVKVLRFLHFGSAEFCVKVEAFSTDDGTGSAYECVVTGRGEGRVTGLIAAQVGESLYQSSFPAGVFHIEQLFQPLDILSRLSSYGLHFHHQNLEAGK